jgi:hypothetical protein
VQPAAAAVNGNYDSAADDNIAASFSGWQVAGSLMRVGDSSSTAAALTRSRQPHNFLPPDNVQPRNYCSE